VSRGIKQREMVRRGQMRPQQPDRRQRGRAVPQALEEHRKLPRRACRLDAVIRRVFGEVQDGRAVGEQRGGPLPRYSRRASTSASSATSVTVADRSSPTAFVVAARRSSSVRRGMWLIVIHHL